MGMQGIYRRLPVAQFKTLLEDPDATDKYFGWDIDEDDDDKNDAHYAAELASGRYLDIDKAWHGLQFLLTGEAAYDEMRGAPPLCRVVQGGEPTAWEAGYGPVRFLRPKQVQEIAGALQQLSETELRRRYRPSAFRAVDIYPGGEVWNEAGIEFLLEVFGQVCDFFVLAAREGEVVLLSIE